MSESIQTSSKIRWRLIYRLLVLIIALVAVYGATRFLKRMKAADNQKQAVMALSTLEHAKLFYRVGKRTVPDSEIDTVRAADDNRLRRWLGNHFFDEVIEVWLDSDAKSAHIKRLPYLRRLILHGPEVTDEALENVVHSEHLELLSLEGTDITDTGLMHVVGLPELQVLQVIGVKQSAVSDAALEHVGSLTNLRGLRLSGLDVTDTGLKQLSRLTGLEWIVLSWNSGITGEGFAALTSLPQLRRLVLSNTGVTDAGLAQLDGTQLTTLVLTDTQVTSEGVQRLQQALPNCKIEL